jgi:type I restriction enzyme S subunit
MYGANVGQLGWLRKPATVNQAICGLVVDERKADWRFLFYALLLNRGDLTIQAQGAAQQNLNQDLIRQFCIDLPPLPIQRRIAGILSAYDELIENSQRRIKILEAMARALYREWFVHFRFPGHESTPRIPSPLGEIPQGWEVKPIQRFGKVITGKTPSKANAEFYGDKLPFVKTPDMHSNMFILSTNERLSTAGAESQSNKTLPAGTICVSCIGTIGVVSITTEDCQTNQQINSLVIENGVEREFLFLRLQDAKQTLENLGANGATMGNVNKGKFETMEIVTPPTELLVDYHRIARPLFEEILALSRQIQNLRRTRDLLLPRLLSGQIDMEALAS